jgi:hypothetical protein
MKVWTQVGGEQCVQRLASETSFVEGCLSVLSPGAENFFSSLPLPLHRAQPWWASQGQIMYPNMNFPGPWVWPGIQQKYYPGEGQIFAAKPNVYVDSVHVSKKFTMKFITSKKSHFLATTPVLSKALSWSGKIIEKDKFEVEEVFYDYLFYDVRLPKDNMQFENGMCATREGAIQWMLKDLKDMRFSDIAMQDFEEHWRVKIPDYPFYCVYPQYNSQLDPVLPVEIDIDRHTFIRSLYVLVPHKKEPNIGEPEIIPFPIKDPAEFRPGALVRREVEFREWGVAFLGY